MASAGRGTYGLPEPPGWSANPRPKFALLAVLGLGCTLAGLAVAGADGGSRVVGIVLATFGLTMCSFLPLAWPTPPAQRVLKVTINTHLGPERGVGFPYSVFRNSMTIVGAALFTVTSIELMLLPQGGIGTYPPVLIVRIAGAVGAVTFGAFTVVGLRRVVGRQAAVVLTPSSVSYVRGASVIAAPWEAITGVGIGPLQGQWFIALGVHKGELSIRGPGSWLDHLLKGSNHRRGADLSFPDRGLAGDLLLVFHAITYYLDRPDARAELGTEAGIGRVRRADLVPAGAESKEHTVRPDE